MNPDESTHEKALAFVRDSFRQAIAMRTIDLELINASRPLALKYHSREEAFRDFWHAAGAVSTFAVKMGLITPADAASVLREYGKKT